MNKSKSKGRGRLDQLLANSSRDLSRDERAHGPFSSIPPDVTCVASESPSIFDGLSSFSEWMIIQEAFSCRWQMVCNWELVKRLNAYRRADNRIYWAMLAFTMDCRSVRLLHVCGKGSNLRHFGHFILILSHDIEYNSMKSTNGIFTCFFSRFQFFCSSFITIFFIEGCQKILNYATTPFCETTTTRP